MRTRPQSSSAAAGPCHTIVWPQIAIVETRSTKRRDLFDAAVAIAASSVPDLEPVSLEGYSMGKTAVVLAAVDVTLMTSDYEGAPLTVKESLACMTPVVSVNVGDVARTIAGLPGCAIAAREPAALAQGVLRALEAGPDIALRHRAERFSSSRVAARTRALYGDVLRVQT
jgi:glycosyltransferase involved in cell wall biosynthesis